MKTGIRTRIMKSNWDFEEYYKHLTKRLLSTIPTKIYYR